MAPGSMASVEVRGFGGTVCGGGEEGACIPPCCPKGGVKAMVITPLVVVLSLFNQISEMARRLNRTRGSTKLLLLLKGGGGGPGKNPRA